MLVINTYLLLLTMQDSLTPPIIAFKKNVESQMTMQNELSEQFFSVKLDYWPLLVIEFDEARLFFSDWNMRDMGLTQWTRVNHTSRIKACTGPPTFVTQFQINIG